MNLSEIQIDQDALRQNLSALRSLLGSGQQVAAVVKGNAYGHGLTEVVQSVDSQVDYFQVDDIDELEALRRLTQRPALVLGYVPKGQVQHAIRLGCELAVYDEERLDDIAEAGKSLGTKVKVHLKVDALLGRQGVQPCDAAAIAARLAEYPSIQLAAAYSHFANIEDTTDLSHAHSQIETFEDCLADLNRRVGRNLDWHESATSGLMVFGGRREGNAIARLGIGLYGLYPSASLERSHQHLNLKPVMKWVSHLAQVKSIPARHPVGYGLTYIAHSDLRIGIVPQGYSDGYDRGLSNSGQVLVRGQRCPVIGRIAMNMFAIDLSRCPEAQPEDEVVLLGEQGSEEVTAEEIAQRVGSINYEIVTRVSPLLPRVVI